MMIGRWLPLAADMSRRLLSGLRLARARGRLALQLRLELAERRAVVREQKLARELHRNRWRVAAHARDECHLHDFERFAFFVRAMLHRGCDRADESVGDEN